MQNYLTTIISSLWNSSSTWNLSCKVLAIWRGRKNPRRTQVSKTWVPSLRNSIQLGLFVLGFFFFFIFILFFFYWASSFWDPFLWGPCCLIFDRFGQRLANPRPNQSTTSSLRFFFFFFEKNFTWVCDVLGFCFFVILGFFFFVLLVFFCWVSSPYLFFFSSLWNSSLTDSISTWLFFFHIRL